MNIPLCTYRLQLNASFTLKEVAELINYLHALGITTIYASPFFGAPAGSTHGYDVCDPHVLNNEIGALQQLAQLTVDLRKYNMTWLQDVVPNHMVFAMTNKRLADVLERGVYSPYYKWFDIDWQHPDPELHGKLMVPVLAKPLPECLHNHELSIDLCETGFVIKYMEQRFPLSMPAYASVSMQGKAAVFDGVEKLLQQLTAETMRGLPLPAWLELKASLITSFLANEQHATAVTQLLAAINADEKWLQAILRQQYYQLSWWQQANQKINYRRFFAVNELIATNMADEEVFADHHVLLKELYEQNIIHGLRIDHIDGLQEPGVYLNRLRQKFGNDCYIVVEKILEQNESLPPQWPIQGTTGYEFTSQVGWLLTNQPGAKELVRYYQALFPTQADYNRITFEKKWHFLETYMGGEWENLLRYLYTLQLVPDTANRDALKQALGMFMCCLPVYRLYPEDGPPDATAQRIIKETFEVAVQQAPHLLQPLTLLQTIWQTDQHDVEINSRRLVFQKRVMQFTGPLTAKGIEDTTFYVYNALLGHNEVGDTPAIESYSVNQFHQWLLKRQQQYPFSLNATATHDTKRGEDGRIRVNVLTWFANYWQELVEHWRLINVDRKIPWNGELAPLLHDEYFIYQSLVAGFPEDGQVTAEYTNRLKDYFIKSVREAKLYTNWQQPDIDYEEAGCRFIENILDPGHDFLNSFQPFFKSILAYARVFSLTQVLIKITAPGVPDIYQGSELWNTSYVDPDNRRPVDYTKRKKYLQQLIELEKQGLPAVYSYITCNQAEGLEKLFVTWKALQCRRNNEALFLQGSYIPVYASVDCGIISFVRQYEKQWVLVVAPVSDNLLHGELSADLFILLPPNAPTQWKNEFTGETIEANGSLPLHLICNIFPVALLTGYTK